jgi:hypothetical protein
MNDKLICVSLLFSGLSVIACGVAPGDREGATEAVSALSTCAPGSSIALVSRANGHDVTAVLGPTNTPLRARADQILGWEKYTIVNAGGGWVALRSNANGLYVSADLNAQGALESAWATTIGDWEKFQFVPADTGWYGILAHANGLYVSADLDQSEAPLQAGWATKIQLWEEFQCVALGNTTPGPVAEDQVKYDRYGGGGDIDQWIAQACAAIGVPYNNNWKLGYETLCQRESSWAPNAINTSDGNAVGPIVADGHPQNCSRGVAQTIPPTFATYHAAGTSLEIYDPVANIAASMKYVMDAYRVSPDGSNLAANVQQADPHRPPHGY